MTGKEKARPRKMPHAFTPVESFIRRYPLLSASACERETAPCPQYSWAGCSTSSRLSTDACNERHRQPGERAASLPPVATLPRSPNQWQRPRQLPVRVLNIDRPSEDIGERERLRGDITRHRMEWHQPLLGQAVLNSTEEPIRVLIVDDHPVMRDGLRAAIEQEEDLKVVGEAADGAQAIEQFHKLLPDVTLLDLQMPRVDGLQAITTIRQEYPLACIVVLTTYPGDARVTRAMTLGATSYLLKTACRDEILRAIRSAVLGRHVVAPEVAHDIDTHRGSENLTIRELSVLRLVAEGKSNRAIGEALFVSEDTVKARMKSILAKLDAGDRTHAVTIAIRRGVIDS